jgi:hypothetical protein
MFLYRPESPTRLGGGAPEMTAGFRREDGEWCFGINSMQLSRDLHVGSEEIFQHNRSGTLFLEADFEVPPSHGATGAKRYVFRIGERTVGLTIEAAPTGSG